jgi:hypothetical protein
LAIAGPNDKPAQPRIDGVRITQASDVPPGGYQRILHRIVRAVVIAQDEHGQTEESGDRGIDKLAERSVITSSGANRKVSLHQCSHAGTAFVAAIGA